jgi:hypothetical protein
VGRSITGDEVLQAKVVASARSTPAATEHTPLVMKRALADLRSRTSNASCHHLLYALRGNMQHCASGTILNAVTASRTTLPHTQLLWTASTRFSNV